MKRGIAVICLAVAGVLVVPTSASAAGEVTNQSGTMSKGSDSKDHRYGGDRDCGDGGYCAGEDERGDCRDSGSNCQDNDFSPSFEDSPVRDAFNFAPVICLPGSTCNVERGGGSQEEQQPQG